MKILVTGCAGFIGSHLCESLIRVGHQVVGIDNFDSFYSRATKERNILWLRSQPNFSFNEVEISNAMELGKITDPIDMVVHLAAKAGVRPSLERPLDYVKANVEGTQNVLEFMRSKGIRHIVFASSSSVYGDDTPAPYKETAMVEKPISPYAFTKRSCELLLYSYHHLYKINTVMLRFFTVYGPRQRPDLAINKFFTAIENSQPIQVYGKGDTSRDYTFIHDIINGIRRSIDYLSVQEKCYEIINLGNNKPTLLIELIKSIEKTVGKPADLKFVEPQPGDVQMTCADITKANKLIGYVPEVDIEKGLQFYYDWRKENA